MGYSLLKNETIITIFRQGSTKKIEMWSQIIIITGVTAKRYKVWVIFVETQIPY